MGRTIPLASTERFLNLFEVLARNQKHVSFINVIGGLFGIDIASGTD